MLIVQKTFSSMSRNQNRQHVQIEEIASTQEELIKTFKELRGAFDVQYLDAKYHGIDLDEVITDIECQRKPARQSESSSPTKRQLGGGNNGGGDEESTRSKCFIRSKFRRVKEFCGKNEAVTSEEDDEEEEVEIHCQDQD